VGSGKAGNEGQGDTANMNGKIRIIGLINMMDTEFS